MKKNSEIKHSHSATLTLVMGGGAEREGALSPFGPVRAGLTTSPKISAVHLRLVSHSTWVKPAVIQPSKSLEDCGILSTDIPLLVGRGDFILEKGGTK